MKEIIEALKNCAELGHQIGYTEVDGEAEADCEADCSGCQAQELHEMLEGMPTVICLCGSTRFGEAFRKAGLEETIAGKIVLSIGCNMRTDSELLALGQLTSATKTRLDELHKRKIDLCDEVLVLNVGGYIGESTRSEIEHAKKRGKRLRFLEPTMPQ